MIDTATLPTTPTRNQHDAVALVIAALESNAVLHATATDACPITAGRVATPGEAGTWCVLTWPHTGSGRGGEPTVDDCGSLHGVARAVVRTYCGAIAASTAALLALG